MVVVNTPGGYAEILEIKRDEVLEYVGKGTGITGTTGTTLYTPKASMIRVRLIHSGDEIEISALCCTGAMLVDKDFKPVELPPIERSNDV